MPEDSAAILTPSRITTRKRYEFATASMRSLRKAMGKDIDLYVVHHSPKRPRLLPAPLYKLMPAYRWDQRAESVYAGSRDKFVRRSGRGSAPAMRDAVASAQSDNKEYGFIHLDDHVYHAYFGDLFRDGMAAMEGDKDLLWVRFSGYPLICRDRPELKAVNDRVCFDTVELTPRRFDDFTLWWSSLDRKVVRGIYWPVAMWFCIFRLDVLARMLDMALERSVLHLANVELYFKNELGFDRLREEFPDGKFGYINMQNGGIEMHRNANWPELMNLPNEALK